MKRVASQKLVLAVIAGVALSGCGETVSDSEVVGYSQALPVIEPAYGQVSYAPMPAVPAGTGQGAAAATTLLSAYQIDQLTGPVALYPDPLLAVLLPAATYPDEVAAAAAWLKTNPQPTEAAINAQPWDSSVKALLHYPTVLDQMAGNMPWTEALGAAFLYQEQDVMASIQRLRGEAMAAGNLPSTPYQSVLADEGAVEIVPTAPDYLCVPVYNPLLVYAEPCEVDYGYYPFFGGLDFCFDWWDQGLYCGDDWNQFRAGGFNHRDLAGGRPWVRDSRRAGPVMPQSIMRSDHRSIPLSISGGYGRPAISAGVMGNQALPSWQGISRAGAGVQPYYAPQGRYEAPRYGAPQYGAPRYEAPRFNPPTRYEAPRFSPPMRSSPMPRSSGASEYRGGGSSQGFGGGHTWSGGGGGGRSFGGGGGGGGHGRR